MGVAETFGLLYMARAWLELAGPVVMSLMYLKLSVSGHFTVFVARTEGPFWSYRPSNVLFGAVVATQVAATLIVVYGLHLMAPIGWLLAGLVWGYSIFWFLVEDRVKLIAYRWLGYPRAKAVLLKSNPQPGHNWPPVTQDHRVQRE